MSNYNQTHSGDVQGECRGSPRSGIPTPRTDAEEKRCGWPKFYFDFAREFERENAALQSELSHWKAVVRYNQANQRKHNMDSTENDSDELCSDCPPIGYPTDKTRCAECPRRDQNTPHDP